MIYFIDIYNYRLIFIADRQRIQSAEVGLIKKKIPLIKNFISQFLDLTHQRETRRISQPMNDTSQTWARNSWDKSDNIFTCSMLLVISSSIRFFGFTRHLHKRTRSSLIA